jgi:hypothetical protein
VAKFDSLLYNIVGSFDSPLYNKAPSHDSPLCYAAESFEIREYLREFKAKFETILNNLSGPLVQLFYEEKGDEKSHDTVPLKSPLS